MMSAQAESTARAATTDNTSATIGTIVTYRGTEHAYLRGHKCRIAAVIKGGARADFNPDTSRRIIDPLALEDVGGITADDRVDLEPWIVAESRWSFAASDARADEIDIAKDGQ